MKKALAWLLALTLVFSLAACTQGAQPTPTAADDGENYETGDASLDDPRNQDDIGEKELLVISFGTSYNDSRRLTIGAIEQDLADACPDYAVRRGFTSQIIIDHVKSRDKVTIDNVGEALDRAVANGVKTLVVQPTHLMDGLEYNDLVNELAEYSDAFEKVAVGAPLLTSDEDFQAVIKAITEATKEFDDGETAICFMGHGTEAASNQVYAKLQKLLTDGGYAHYYVGTVEASPTLDDVLAAVKEGTYKKVVLQPLMIVAGDHANNDMAGDEEDSWKSAFEAAGYEVNCQVKGLGELEAIRQILVEHAQAAIAAAEQQPATGTTEPTPTAEPAPTQPAAVKDGTYAITVDSSSSMFKIVDCQLTVEGGKMTAVMTMSGTGYGKLYLGTGEQAATAGESEYIYPVEDAQGAHTFTVPVSALDEEIACAAYSNKKETWYDRTLVFRSDSLGADALAEGSMTTAESLNLADGTYTVAVTLEGGSGKASVQSPAQIKVEGGKVTATVVMSSSNYDYMKVDGVQYDYVTLEGGSTFEIPVAGFDWKMPILADTVAMSTPHEVAYTLCFDSASIQSAK